MIVFPHCEPSCEIWRLETAGGESPQQFSALANGLFRFWKLTAHSPGGSGYDIIGLDDYSAAASPLASGGAGLTWVDDDFGHEENSVQFGGGSPAHFSGSLAVGAFATGSVTFICAVNLASKAATQGLWWVGFNLTTTGLALLYDAALDRFVFRMVGNTTLNLAADAPGSPATDQWYIIECSFANTAATGAASIRVQTGEGAGASFVNSTVTPPQVTYPVGSPLEAAPAASVANVPAGGIWGSANGLRIGSLANTNWISSGSRMSGVGIWRRRLNSLELAEMFARNYPPIYIWPAESVDISDYPAAPADPSGLLATGTGPITLSWTDNSPGEEHEVWGDDAAGGEYTLLATLASGVDEYEDAAGTEWTKYKVRAIGRGNPSAFVEWLPAPDAPVITSAVQDGSDIDLAWTHPAQSDPTEADNYEVEKNVDGGGWTVVDAAVDEALASLSFAHGGSEGGSVLARIRAVKNSVAGAWAESAAVDIFAFDDLTDDGTTGLSDDGSSQLVP